MSAKQKYLTFRLDGGKFTRTDEGFLDCVGACARTGIQLYRDENGKERREFRPESEVFSEASMDSHKLRPITDRHPSVLVTSGNACNYMVGVTGPSPRRDGKFLMNTFRIMDEGVINEILARRDRGETTEISMGYMNELEFKPGVTEDGEAYDAIQRNIVINHAALLDQGMARAGRGAQLRLDSGDTAASIVGMVEMLTEDGRGSLQTVVVSKKAAGTKKEAEELAQRFMRKGQKPIKSEETGESFRFRVLNPENIQEGSFKSFPVPGAEGVTLVFGKIKEDEHVSKKLQRKRIDVGNFRMDAVELSFTEDGEAAVTLLCDKLDEAALVIQAALDERDKLQASVDQLTADSKKTESELAQRMDINSPVIQGMIKEHQVVTDAATHYKIDTAGKSLLDVKKAVVAAGNPSLSLDGKSEAYIEGSFDAALTRIEKEKADDKGSRESNGAFRQNADSSTGSKKVDHRAEFIKKSQDAWKS